MKDFKQVLYESLLVSFGKVLSKYNAFAQGTVLHDVGMEIIDYLNKKHVTTLDLKKYTRHNLPDFAFDKMNLGRTLANLK